jgi:hypothetical protein
MNNGYLKLRKSAELLGAICGGLLISVPAIPLAASAQQRTAGVNPCPRIFYEPPHNTQVLVPQGCPPNAFTQQRDAQGTSSTQTAPVTVSPQVPTTTTTPQPSATEPAQAPSATIALSNGKVTVRLVNDTAANITYEVIGDTPARSLTGKSDVMLQNLSAPVTVTFQREDGGLLTVTPQPSSEPGMLEVRLKEATDVGKDRGAMRIQQNGAVLLN